VLAALLVEPGRIVVDDVSDPEVGPDDVLVTVGGVGLCGSDLSVFHGRWKPPAYPWIMGHESFGTVAAVGRDVAASRLGELVIIEPNAPCGSCGPCARGRTSACERRRSLGRDRAGALAELVAVPAHLAWAVRARDPRDLVCAEPFTVVETGLRRLGGPLPESALVMGAGSQGLLMSLALRRRGLHVHVADIDPRRVAFAVDRLDVAGEPGADERFALIVDTTGVPAAFEAAVGAAEVGATVLELGLDARPLRLASETLVRRQLVLRGSLTYDHPADFAATISLLDGDDITLGLVLSDEHPLSEAQSAFEGATSAVGKSWIRMAAES
jgi:alcohol dehydrogenase/L-iditol 2-dehydrogenase